MTKLSHNDRFLERRAGFRTGINTGRPLPASAVGGVGVAGSRASWMMRESVEMYIPGITPRGLLGDGLVLES